MDEATKVICLIIGLPIVMFACAVYGWTEDARYLKSKEFKKKLEKWREKY